MASVAYSLHQVSPAPLREEREAPGTYTRNSRSIGFPESRAASQGGPKRESVGSSPGPPSDLNPVRTAAPGGGAWRSGQAAEVSDTGVCIPDWGSRRGMNNDPKPRPNRTAPSTEEGATATAREVITVEELAASVALELNQPLTNIAINASACLQFLAGDAPNIEEARQAVREIVLDAKRAGEAFLRIQALKNSNSLRE